MFGILCFTFSFLSGTPVYPPAWVRQHPQPQISGVVRPTEQPRQVRRADSQKGRPVAPVDRGIRRVANYHLRYGVQFPPGHPYAGLRYYLGWNHHQWTRYKFFPLYGTYLYWCPYATSWYYWCAPDLSYYPISYVPYNSYTVESGATKPTNDTDPPEPPDPSKFLKK